MAPAASSIEIDRNARPENKPKSFNSIFLVRDRQTDDFLPISCGFLGF